MIIRLHASTTSEALTICSISPRMFSSHIRRCYLVSLSLPHYILMNGVSSCLVATVVLWSSLPTHLNMLKTSSPFSRFNCARRCLPAVQPGSGAIKQPLLICSLRYGVGMVARRGRVLLPNHLKWTKATPQFSLTLLGFKHLRPSSRAYYECQVFERRWVTTIKAFESVLAARRPVSTRPWRIFFFQKIGLKKRRKIFRDISCPASKSRFNAGRVGRVVVGAFFRIGGCSLGP